MSLGLRLKRLRETKMMSVKDLAAELGVSRSFIHQLERQEVSPSYSTLHAMAGVLGTSVAVLVGDDVPEEWLVVRSESRKRLILPETQAEPGAGPAARLELVPFLGTRNRRMRPVVLVLPPKSRLDTLPFNHEREDLLFVTEGQVSLLIDRGRELVLSAGDSAYLIFEDVTSVANHGDQPATCLWVVSPAG